MNKSLFDPPSDPYGGELTCWNCGKPLEKMSWGWECRNTECGVSDMYIPQEEIDVDDLCDCGEPFPKNGYCEFCGAHKRYKE